VLVPRQESEWSCICFLGVPILPFSAILLLEFGNVPTVWYFLFFYWSLEMFRQCGIFLFFIIFYVIQTIFKLQNVSKPFSKEMFQSLCPFCPRRNENYSVNKLLFISLRQMTWLKWWKLKESSCGNLPPGILLLTQVTSILLVTNWVTFYYEMGLILVLKYIIMYMPLVSKF
jgi:hypothetical protein